MRAKNVIMVFAVAVMATQALAQPYGDPNFKKKFKQADGLAYSENYAEALVLFEDMYAFDSTNANINRGVGLCHLGLGHYKKAAQFLETATRNVALDYQEANWKEKRAPGKTYYYLASAYHHLGQYDLAVSNYFNYRSFIDMDDYEVYNNVKRQIEYAETAKELSEFPVDVKINKLPGGINSMYEDFCPVISADGKTLIFTSRRESGTGSALTETGEYFDDIFVCKKVGSTWSKPTSIGSNINSADHEAAIGLSADGQTLYVYKNDDIYYSVLQGNVWSQPKKMGSDINSNSWETHATVSADGNLLVFTSNRPGGKGGRDLYYSRKLPDGDWSLVQNMGDSINTPYEEESPFLTVDGKSLIFSSQGHRSMGGFDLFRSEMRDGVWSSPKNIGYPINSPENDMFFVTSPDGRQAYYSSVREGGLGAQDIYVLKLPQAKAASVTVLSGKMTVPAMDYSNLQARIKVSEADGGAKVGEYRPNRATGKYILILDPGVDYNVTYEADGYASKNVLVDVPDNSTYYEIAKTIELDEVIFGDELIALQNKKKREEEARLAALQMKAEQDSLALLASAQSEEQLALLAKQQEDERTRQAVEDQLALDAQNAKNARMAAEAEALEAERKRLAQEAVDNDEANAQAAKIAEAQRVEREKAAAIKFTQEQEAEQARIAAAQQAEAEAEIIAQEKVEADKLAEDQRLEQERVAATKAQAEADRIAKEKETEIATAKTEQANNTESAVSTEQEVAVVEAPVETIDDPVARKRAELLARIQKLKDQKSGVGYTQPAEEVVQEAPKEAEQVVANVEPKTVGKVEQVEIEKTVEGTSEVSAQKQEILARIEKLKQEQDAIMQTQSEEEIAATAAAKEAENADAELERLKQQQEMALAKKKTAVETAKKAKAAKAVRMAAADAKQKEHEDLLVQMKRIEEQAKKDAVEAARKAAEAKKARIAEENRQAELAVEAERKRQEEEARVESLRLEELARQEEATRVETERVAEEARQAEVARVAEEKKQQAIAAATLTAEQSRSQNNNANDMAELRKMNERLIKENMELRSQFAEINRKLDIIITNMAVTGVASTKVERITPAPRESLFSAEDLKSGKNFVLKNIFFDYNQASLQDKSKKELNKLYYFLKDNPGVSITIEGHTDSRGDDGYNMRLSQTRAESVVRYLTNMGIGSRRLQAIGYGEKRPIAINENPDGTDNPSGRALNRRIEISLPQGGKEKLEVEKITIPKGLQIGS